MKKFVFTIGICFLFLFSAQTHSQTAIIFGPEAGVNFAKTSVSDDFDIADDYSRILKFQGGLNAGVQFGQWGIMTGIKFNQKGGKATLERRDPNNPFTVTDDQGNVINDVGEIIIKESTNWLSVPLMGRVQFGQGPLKFGLAIGPQFNFGIGKLKQEVEYNLTVTNLSSEEETSGYGDSATDVYKPMHLSLVINPSVWYDLSPNSSLKFGFMFESGADMVNENYLVSDGAGVRKVDATSKANNFGVLIGYEYRFDINVGVKY